MKKKAIQFLKGNFFPILIVLITIYLSLVNYQSETWLTGWDTLHPEFNFPLNFKRLIFGVWREEQGLGAVTGHSHMADLPRVILLSLASLVFPPHFLRFFYFALCLILGPLGVWFFLEKVIFKDKQDPAKKIAAFLGGLFYLLNLGTLQHFYVPFEMFAALYAALPWLFLLASKYLIEENKRDLLFFCLVTFLSAPMAYAATLWYVYFVALAIYLFSFHFVQLKTFSKFKKILLIFLLTIIINSYWFLPNIYFLATSAKNVPQAKINQLFSQKAFSHDAKYANIENAALLRSFLFDWQEFNNGEFIDLLDEWKRHLENPQILIIGFILFSFVLFGIGASILRREKPLLSLIPVFLFSFFFLVYATYPLNQVFAFLQDNFSTLKEALRFPWAKFSIIVMFCFSCYFSNAVFSILNLFKRFRTVPLFVFLILTGLSVVWMFPAFEGNLISSSRRINLPTDYSELFSWFKKQPESQRVGVFPIPTFWGWEYYRWGFEGAGFIWFGLKQPILARDFDRWSPYNENYYWEISYALYSGNLELFEKVLEKYQINWLLVDGNVINPSFPKALFLEELKQILSSSDKISLARQFDKIKIYQVNLKTPIKDFVFLAQNLPVIGPKYNWSNYDLAYLENGNYISSPTSHSYYPFRSLFTGKNQEDLEFEVEDKEDYFLFKKVLPETVKNYQLQIPEFIKEELMRVNPDDLTQVQYLSPKVYLNDTTLEVKIPKVGGYFSAEIKPTDDPSVKDPKNCNPVSRGQVDNKIIEEDGEKFLRLTSLDTNNCSASFWLPNLPHQLSYLITAVSRHREGKSLLFWLENLNIRKADIETYLPKKKEIVKSYLIQPPMEEDGLGYTIHFDNISIGQEKTINDLGKITVNPIPFNFLTNLRLVSPQTGGNSQKQVISIPKKVSHPNPSFYSIEGDFAPNQFLVLSQSFHPGWQAFTIDGFSIERIRNHVLVNNWANGWLLEPSQLTTHNLKLYIIFLPQLLEYFGFILLLVSVALLLIFC